VTGAARVLCLSYRRVVYRFLLTPRWLGLAVVVLALSAVAVRLGMWQFDRLDERRAANVAIRANLAADPVPVDSLLSVGDAVEGDLEWRAVTATGTYDGDAELVVRNQTREAGPGASVVVPLTTEGGEVVLVERGWVSTAGSPTELPDVDPPPAGRVTVTGWLRRDSPAGPEATDPVDGTVRAINSAMIGDALGRDLLPGYVALTDQEPAADAALEPPVPPDLGQGPHFFYGLQWWFFALLAVVGYLWFAWSEAHPKAGSKRPDRPAPRPPAEALTPTDVP
jgi:cytochrome oxidase assembly protein ShyY1